MKHSSPSIFQDSTLALRRDPYRFISRTCRARGADAFATRLLLEPALCMSGRKAAAHFYRSDLFTRDGAAPRFLRRTLVGEGGVQGLEGARHRRRKALFLDLVGPGREAAIVSRLRDRLAAFAASPPRGRFELQDAFETLLTQAVCDWTRVPLPLNAVGKRAELLASLFDLAVSTLSGHLRARRARRVADAWIGGLIGEVRANALAIDPETPLAQVAGWTEPDGAILRPRRLQRSSC